MSQLQSNILDNGRLDGGGLARLWYLEYYCTLVCDGFVKFNLDVDVTAEVDSSFIIVRDILSFLPKEESSSIKGKFQSLILLTEFCHRLWKKNFDLSAGDYFKSINDYIPYFFRKFDLGDLGRSHLQKALNSQLVLLLAVGNKKRLASNMLRDLERTEDILFPADLKTVIGCPRKLPLHLRYNAFLLEMKQLVSAVMDKLESPVIQDITRTISMYKVNVSKPEFIKGLSEYLDVTFEKWKDSAGNASSPIRESLCFGMKMNSSSCHGKASLTNKETNNTSTRKTPDRSLDMFEDSEAGLFQTPPFQIIESVQTMIETSDSCEELLLVDLLKGTSWFGKISKSNQGLNLPKERVNGVSKNKKAVGSLTSNQREDVKMKICLSSEESSGNETFEGNILQSCIDGKSNLSGLSQDFDADMQSVSKAKCIAHGKDMGPECDVTIPEAYSNQPDNVHELIFPDEETVLVSPIVKKRPSRKRRRIGDLEGVDTTGERIRIAGKSTSKRQQDIDSYELQNEEEKSQVIKSQDKSIDLKSAGFGKRNFNKEKGILVKRVDYHVFGDSRSEKDPKDAKIEPKNAPNDMPRRIVSNIAARKLRRRGFLNINLEKPNGNTDLDIELCEERGENRSQEFMENEDASKLFDAKSKGKTVQRTSRTDVEPREYPKRSKLSRERQDVVEVKTCSQAESQSATHSKSRQSTNESENVPSTDQSDNGLSTSVSKNGPSPNQPENGPSPNQPENGPSPNQPENGPSPNQPENGPSPNQSENGMLDIRMSPGESVTWSSDEESAQPQLQRGRRRNFTMREEDWLREGVRDHGLGQWTKILHEYPFYNRTSVNLKDKWRNLVKNGATNM